jgi:hypothetical protein
MSSSTQSLLSSSTESYIDKFGYHFAEKLLAGNNDDFSLLFQQSTNASAATTKGPPCDSPISFYRAHWRSETIPFSRDLSSNIQKVDNDNENAAAAASEPTVPSIETEAIFVDVTFDFVVIHPSNDAFHHRTTTSEEVKVLSTAVRIGALLVLPTANGYRSHYLRGNPLEAKDIYDHCRNIDIDPENSRVDTLATMMASSFRLASSSSWRVVGESILNSNNHWQWTVLIHHSGELEGEVSTLPLCSGTYDDCLGDVVPSNVLDVMLLQRNDNDGWKNACMRIPHEVGRSFWNGVREDWEEKVAHTSGGVVLGEEKRVGTEDASTSCSVGDKGVDDSEQIHAKQVLPPPLVDNANGKRTEQISSGNNHDRMFKSNRPQETVMYAQGKKTSIAGTTRSKKAKFTLGSI